VESSQDAAFSLGHRVLVTGANVGEALDGGLSEYARLPALAVVPLLKTLSLFEGRRWQATGKGHVGRSRG